MSRGATILIASLALMAGTLAPGAAQANTPIFSFSASPSTTQAGGHPDVTIHAVFATSEKLPPGGCDCSNAKNLITNLPPGLIGDPHAIPQCTQLEFASATCPVDSQIGVSAFGIGLTPVFNLEPAGDQAGLIGLIIPGIHTPLFEIISPRTESDYGLKVSVLGVFNGGFLSELHQRLWGVPADPIHDVLRFPLSAGVCFGSSESPLMEINWTELGSHPCGFGPKYTGTVPSNSPLKPFLDNPTSCGTPLASSLQVDSYDGGTAQLEAPWPATTGCDQLSFNPSLFAQPTTGQTDSASGLDVNLSAPQNVSPTVPSSSEIRAATVTLPEGFSINPNAADGKTSCDDLEANFGTELAAQCPEFSKVGAISIDSSALPAPLPGYVYLGRPLPGNRYRVFLVADGFSVHVKLPGTVTPDPQTGQLVVSFQNLPQTPISNFNLHFFGSERGLLATPTQCGTYAVKSTFTPWDSALPEQTSTQFFTLDSGPGGAPCPGADRPFDPRFAAGVADNTAGVHSPFTLDLTRNDGDQTLSALTVNTPPGFAATLAGIPYCSDAALAAAANQSYSGLGEVSHPSCPADSQVGTAVAGAGAGDHPLYLAGKTYLAGPYKGAPLSLAVITPAISGPYDLGNVVVRVALHVDSNDAHITAVSDPLPQIFNAIPLRLREVRIHLDRQGFALNPTNCDPFSIDTSITGDQGARAGRSAFFQVANCASLPFAPRLSLRVSGSTRRTGNPALHAVLTASAGEAGIASTSVTLPPSEVVDNAHIQGPCTKAQFAADNCPAGSILGSAKVETPLLAKPLEGPVYLASGYGHKLPDIVAALHGQIDINLDGQVKTVHERLRATFKTVPDAPISKFTLDLSGGARGLLENSKPLCRTPQVVAATIVGQNGMSADQSPTLKTPCAKSAGRRGGR